VAADAELFRVANLSQVSVEFSLDPADAGRIAPGTALAISAPGRRGSGRVTFVSPALDETTKLVPAIASVRNSGGIWRVGEPVQAALQLPASDDRTVTVPQVAVQTVEGRTVVFVRTRSGFRVAPVRLGARSGEWIVVLAGLTGREIIAAANSFTLKAEIGKGEAEHEH
jgi:cobalt-zinc-cadmium efflux system membrane fusion protein